MIRIPESIVEWEQLAREARFSPSQMALLCSVSDRHLQRLFKKHLGCPPRSWLRQLRCRMAKDLIAQGYSSKAAAAELHYASDAHFCHEFKKVTGVPPQTFAPNRVGYQSLSILADIGPPGEL